MARTKYEMTICDGDDCGTIGRKTTEAGAKKKLLREMRKRAKKLKGGKSSGRVYAALYKVESGVVDTSPIFEAEERYGEPVRRGRRRKRPESNGGDATASEE